jgi:hypothetical protein
VSAGHDDFARIVFRLDAAATDAGKAGIGGEAVAEARSRDPSWSSASVMALLPFAGSR